MVKFVAKNMGTTAHPTNGQTSATLRRQDMASPIPNSRGQDSAIRPGNTRQNTRQNGTSNRRSPAHLRGNSIRVGNPDRLRLQNAPSDGIGRMGNPAHAAAPGPESVNA